MHQPSRQNDEILRRRSFGEVTENMRRVVDRGIRLSVNTVVTRSSIDQVAAMADFARDMGAAKISFIPVVERGRARRVARSYAFPLAEVDEVRTRAAALAAAFGGQLDVRCIDLRAHGYWIVENNGSLWVESAIEETDVELCPPGGIADFLLASLSAPPIKAA